MNILSIIDYLQMNFINQRLKLVQIILSKAESFDQNTQHMKNDGVCVLRVLFILLTETKDDLRFIAVLPGILLHDTEEEVSNRISEFIDQGISNLIGETIIKRLQAHSDHLVIELATLLSSSHCFSQN